MQRNGIISETDIKKTRYKVLYAVIVVCALILSVICLFPPLWVIISAGKDISEFYAVPPTLFPRTFQLDKIIDLWRTHDFGGRFYNTIKVCIGSILFTIVCNGMMGYCISKMKVRGTKLVFTLIFASYLIPSTMSIVPVYKNIISLPFFGVSLLNTNWPMFFMSAANAYMVIVYKSFFDGIPDSLLEAAKLDGCNELGIFYRIVLPLSKPVLFTSVILTFNGTWSDFFWPYMVLKDQAKYTIMVDIFVMQQNPLIRIDTVLIAIAFTIIPPSIIFLFFQRYIMQGFTMSGIKG